MESGLDYPGVCNVITRVFVREGQEGHREGEVEVLPFLEGGQEWRQFLKLKMARNRFYP